MHTLNLALKNICAANNTQRNSVAYDQCSRISQIVDVATFIKKFIVGRSMRISMFNSLNSLKLLSVAPTCFNHSYAKSVEKFEKNDFKIWLLVMNGHLARRMMWIKHNL